MRRAAPPGSLEVRARRGKTVRGSREVRGRLIQVPWESGARRSKIIRSSNVLGCEGGGGERDGWGGCAKYGVRQGRAIQWFQR